jgi:hypothetical protein
MMMCDDDDEGGGRRMVVVKEVEAVGWIFNPPRRITVPVVNPFTTKARRQGEDVSPFVSSRLGGEKWARKRPLRDVYISNVKPPLIILPAAGMNFGT